MIDELVTTVGVENLLLVGVVWLVLGSFLGFWIGRRRDRPVLGVLLGGLLNLPGLFTLVFMPPKEPEFY